MVVRGPKQQGSVRDAAGGQCRRFLEQEEGSTRKCGRSDALDRITCAVVAYGHIPRHYACQGCTVMGRTELDTADEVSASHVQSDRLLTRGEIHHDMVLQAYRGRRGRPDPITRRGRKKLHHLGRRDRKTAPLIPNARPPHPSRERDRPARQEEGPVARIQVVVRRQIRRPHAGGAIDIRL